MKIIKEAIRDLFFIGVSVFTIWLALLFLYAIVPAQ